MKVYRKPILSAGALSVIASACLALPCAAEDWSGTYGGVAVGLIKSDADISTVTQGTQNYFNVRSDHDQIRSNSSKAIKPSDLTGSVVVGHNRQSGNWVYGVEAELNLLSFDEEYNNSNITYISAAPSTFTTTTSVISYWNASLRPRVGYAQDRSLFYLSAGPALTKIHYDFNFSDTFLGGESAHTSSDKFKIGWSAGVGYEHKLDDSWSIKADMSYMRFENAVDQRSNLQGYVDGFIHDVDLGFANARIGAIKRF